MDGFCKFAAGILCAFFLALCLWLSWDVLTAPSNASDSGIAMLCDYARPGDVPELERLCSRIGSPWWAEYARSRLYSDGGGAPREVAARIFEKFRYGEFRAYVLARQALGTPGLEGAFSALPPREAEFAGLIYAINRGMMLDAGVFGDFSRKHLAGAPQRLRFHYAEVLATEAFKRRDFKAAAAIMAEMESPSWTQWGQVLVLSGADPAKFPSFVGVERRELLALHASLAGLGWSGGGIDGLPPVDQVPWGGLSQYNFPGISCRAIVFWKLGHRDEAMECVRFIYDVGRLSRVSRIRTEALENIVRTCAALGKFGLARDFAYADAGNPDMLLWLVSHAALASARTGRMDEALAFWEAFSGLEGRLNLNFHPPYFPERPRSNPR